MKILITGAAGYIGSVLTPTLLRLGHRVMAVDNFMYGQTSLLDCCHDPNFTLVRGDVRDEKLIRSLLSQDVSVVIPLACIVGAPACDKDPSLAKTTNLDAIEMLTNFIFKDQKVIFPNTNSGYGIGQEGIYCDENTPLRPVSLYGQLKVEAEKMILNASGISLRLATVFGASPRMRLDLLVNDLVYRAVNDEYVILFEAHFKRNFVHVRDVVRAFIHCVSKFEDMKGQAYNVGLSTANLSKLELCEEIKRQIPGFYFTEAPLREDPDKRNYVVSNDKIERTGFMARISLDEGIADLIKVAQILPKQFRNI